MTKTSQNKTTEKETKPKCGIVMPISGFDDYTDSHWQNVKAIIQDALSDDFECELVSVAEETKIIHKTIIQNIHDNEIVVCDISGRNPNVMFELGMRLAFDKPAVIIKDRETDYSFDTGIIEHLEYPHLADYRGIAKFKDKLGKKVISTFESGKDSNSFFLGQFGKYKVTGLNEEEVTRDDYILRSIEDVKQDINILNHRLNPFVHKQNRLHRRPSSLSRTFLLIEDYGDHDPEDIIDRLNGMRGIADIEVLEHVVVIYHLESVDIETVIERLELLKIPAQVIEESYD